MIVVWLAGLGDLVIKTRAGEGRSSAAAARAPEESVGWERERRAFKRAVFSRCFAGARGRTGWREEEMARAPGSGIGGDDDRGRAGEGNRRRGRRV